MRLAVPISVACCTECHTSFNWAEYGVLAELDTTTRDNDTVINRRQCDQCDAPVICAGYDELEPERLWRSWELHRTLHPDTRRQPTMIPENRGDRLLLRWLRIDKVSLAAVVSILFAFAAVVWQVTR